jgi:hypothetical protein
MKLSFMLNTKNPGGATLGETIHSELQRFQRNSKKHRGITQEDLEILLQFFKGYYGGKDETEIREKVLEIGLDEILESPDDFIYNITQGIKSYPRDKAVLTDRMIRFLDYLETRYDVSFKKQEFENFKINSQSERLLQILKYLHSGDKNRAQIADAFGISERTLSEDLTILIDGFEFLGTEMKISKLERGTNNYKSHIHPVFLPLNSAEIFALTVGLKITGKDTVFEEIFNRIADLIYKQLSYSAKDMIDNSNYHKGSFEDEPLKFINSFEAQHKKDMQYSYFIKDSTKCNIEFRQDGEIRKEACVIELIESEQGFHLDKIRVRSDNKDFELEIKDIISIERADKGEYFKDWV